ncbi:MAG: SpaH/EbpB family LPXTG-anchored major pilin [Oscillospiraceae bacterium]|nr:SpaH/EbpB family LPXTG-anchored major pilin [Oscillospiraceae bacterium]
MNVKKLSAILFTLILAFSLSSVAFAAPTTVTEDTKGTIDITAQHEGDTFAAYRIVDVTYTAASNSLSYAFDTSVADFFTDKVLTVATYSALTSSTTPTLESVQGELAAWIKTNGVTTTYTGTAGANSICSISTLPLGQYLVLGTGNATSGAYVYQIMTANAVPTVVDHTYVLDTISLTSKVALPTIAKTAADDDNAIVSAYDNINYTITVGVPAYPSSASNRTFTVADVLPTGVSYVTGSLVIKNAADTQILSGTDFSSGVYEFTYADIAAYAGQALTLNYKGVLNASSIDSAIPDELINTATLTYSSNPYGSGTSTVEATATVQTNKFTITKVDSVVGETVLPNAGFDVYAAFTAAQIANLKTDSGAAEATGSALTALTALGTAPTNTTFYKIGSLLTDSSGQAVMHQVENGTYYLIETRAPSGYSLPTSAFTVEVTDDGPGQFNIPNTSNIFLPSTGGAGTVLFTMGGIAILLSAGAFLLLNRKRVFGK